MAAASAPLGVSCITCRRRRVKCDRAIPTCGACKRLSLVCSYKIATPGLYWMPINTVEADTDRVGKQDDAGGYGERTASSHRAPLCTEEERKAMCEQLLRATACMDIDDVMQSLTDSAEAGVEVASLGPFGAFPTHAQSTAANPGPPAVVSPVLSASPPTVIRGSPLAGISDYLAPILSVSSPPSIYDNYESLDVNIFDPLCAPGWEDNLPLGTNVDVLPLEFALDSSSRNPNELESSPETHPYQLPSPLSVNLPIIQPSQALKKVPKDAFLLLEYYGSKMLFFFSPLPNQKPPWKIMHHPSVLETTGALLVDAPVKHAQLALLHSVLAISAFHLDWCASPNQPAGIGSSRVGGGDTKSHWWNIGQQFKQAAKTHLQLALQCEFTGPTKAKYKHILMTLLGMVTICVQTGNMEEGRCFLLDAERAVRLRGLKPHRSRKVRLLHNLFLYNRILEESTFTYTDASNYQTSNGRGLQDDIQSIPQSNAATRDPAYGNPASGDSLTAQPEQTLVDQLIANDGTLFEAVYGVPIALMDLISQATSLAQEVSSQKLSLHSATDLHTVASLARRVRVLEDRICKFQWEPHGKGHGYDNIPTAYVDGLSQPPTTYDNVMRHFISAMHQALLIFFYRRIQGTNPYALQPFVKRTVSELFAFERAKAENSIVTPVPCWPGFIAGCEAVEEDREQIRRWFREARPGWRSFDAIQDALEGFWRARDLSDAGTGTGLGATEVTWEHFLTKHRIAIIPT